MSGTTTVLPFSNRRRDGRRRPNPTASWYLARFRLNFATGYFRLRAKLRASLSTPEGRWLICRISVFVIWAAIFARTIHRSTTGALDPELGMVMRLACTSTLVPSAFVCGYGNTHCRPFEGRPFVFRCPQGCDIAKITSPIFVGNETVNHRSLVIGGPDLIHDPLGVYRGDSHICAAAIHGGQIDSRKGGCAVLRRQGESSRYPGSLQNGIRSIAVRASFPLSFTLEKAGTISHTSACQDPRNGLLLLTGAVTFLYAVLTSTRPPSPPAKTRPPAEKRPPAETQPPSSLPEFVGVTFCILFFHVALVSDSPDEPRFSNFDEVISVTFERFLPAIMVMYGLYDKFISCTLSVSLLQQRLVWLVSAWVGALQNIFFSFIPIPRLTWVDLVEQPKAIVALLGISIFFVVIGIFQARAIIQADQLQQVGTTYVLLLLIVAFLGLIPGQKLRIHHYTYALLFLPATKIPNPLSYIISGFLVGLYINGVARWGFASVLETLADLFPTRSFGSPIPDLQPIIGNSYLSFVFGNLPRGWTGVQALVNDVIVFREFSDGGAPIIFNLTTVLDAVAFVRAAFVREGDYRGLTFGTSSNAGTWTPGDGWVPPQTRT